MLLLRQSCVGILSHGRVRALKDPGHPSEPSSSPSEPFPSPVYSETVLAVNFEEAKRYFLDALLEIHTAHTLMLARQAIIPKAVATVLLEAIAKLDRVGILAARYDGRSEDLFFYVQHLLVESCGEDAAGRMHTARSRNDIDLTLYRMCLRREILRISAETAEARAVLLALAASHLQTLMPAHTHAAGTAHHAGPLFARRHRILWSRSKAPAGRLHHRQSQPIGRVRHHHHGFPHRPRLHRPPAWV